MADELTYKRLRDLLREEKSLPSLSKIPPDYYTSVEAFLSSTFSQMESSNSIMQMREFENATSVIKEISLIRQQKILFKALRSGGEHTKAEDMTREEHEVYDRFCNVIEEENNRLNSLLSRFQHKRQNAVPTARQEPSPEKKEALGGRLKKVRFTKDIQAYIGMNKERFGPFRPGEEGTLPSDEAELLLRERLAELVE